MAYWLSLQRSSPPAHMLRSSPRLWTCYRTQGLKGQSASHNSPQSSQVPRSQSGGRKLRKTVPWHWASDIYMDRGVASISFFFLQQFSFTLAFLSTIAARVLFLLVPGDHIRLRTRHSLEAQSIQKIKFLSFCLTDSVVIVFLMADATWLFEALPSPKCFLSQAFG